MGGKRRVSVAKVERVFAVGEQVEVKLYEVPLGSRFGPWHRRVWTPTELANEILPFSDIITVAELEHGALSLRTLELLAASGVSVGSVGKEKSLPGRAHET